MSRARYDTLFQRLVANSELAPGQIESTACWIWQGNLSNSNYGRYTERVPAEGRVVKVYAHRGMEMAVRDQYNEFDLDDDPLGPIFMVPRPTLDRDTETIDHLCFNRRCVNPDHWNIETRAENTALMHKRKKGH